MASLARASATVFWARGTCVAVQRSNPASVAREADQSGISLASLTRQRPAELLDDELRIEEQVDLASPELAGELEGADDPGVLRHVVGLDTEVVRDRGVRDRAVVAGIGATRS